ncbi:MSMEG_4193 family putative phosphomutase [Dermacoccaceae bacterium W4C1]
MATALFLRHGRTTANTAGVLAGWTPGVGLDEVGRAQVQTLAQRLSELPLSLVVSSPLQRCRETTEALLADRPQVPVQVRDDVGECHYGAWTGRTIRELSSQPLWRVVQDRPSEAVFPPSSEYAHESLAQMQARAVAAVREIDAQVEAEHGARAVWAVVSHGDVIKALLADALGTHLDRFQRIAVNPASLSAVRYTATRPFVLRSNDSGAAVSDLQPAPPAPDAGGGPAPGDAVVGGESGLVSGSAETPKAAG